MSRVKLKSLHNLFRRSGEYLKSFFKRYKEESYPHLPPSGPEKDLVIKESQKAIVRSELNLERNAIFTVSTYKGDSREIVSQEKTEGGIIERKIIVGKTKEGMETGVLTITHFKIYLALIELWQKAGRPVQEPVFFSIHQLIKRLGLTKSGRTYDQIKRGLYGLRQIPIEFIHSFYSNMGNFRSLEPFTILNHLKIFEKDAEGHAEFQFDRWIAESVLQDYVHPLRLDVITSFKRKKDLAILLYTYLDRNLAFRMKFEIGLTRLFETLDLSQNYVRYPSDRKRMIEPVLDELRGTALSTGTLSYLKVGRTKDGQDYKLICRKKHPTELPDKTLPVKPEEWTSLPLDELLGKIQK